ncbi:hypothetical protein PHYBLDRAFT_144595 [Phycomyces blakesleeanus NRRL 1555(-)]|uniref:Uncharacterized protein n=1 Tax=Phycomyces blakesleeanus (strain ATCC 8743b / DSM 1359 / FGSC 10004 / NBRC 33097 / NRRL 1555) TaxID=763407 RepID=A0A163DY65_PHYB8|nr:hypothetical protein PHYBLDRAFT_144595 [Phycomyces blakesleeanus NRRL 1555(-)]OAD74140.1 hypothetical protein PHYBLDRAFT_144595 [Phycomyces blakesleeanus NRRL 1555(-)]|eukprot:XP_018292180.1 hypothetical protein PHYBLDRAFT_144595 [Phycomyces blakesleeanus NRRL 1555(-)]
MAPPSLSIVERIKRDHFTNSFASQSLINEIKQLQSDHDWEADLILQEIRDIYDDPSHPLYDFGFELFTTNNQFIKKLLSTLSNTTEGQTIKGSTGLSTILPSEREELIQKVEDGILRKYSNVESFVMGDKLGPVSETRHRLGVAAVDAESLRSTVEKIKNGLQQRRFDMPLGRIKLTRLVVECIELMLEVLDTTWSIMEEFRLKHEKEMNTVYDEHLGVMVDTLESLRNALEKQHQDVQAELSFANKQIEEYHSMGPEFRTLCSAYFDLLTMIQETEDDIRRINNA